MVLTKRYEYVCPLCFDDAAYEVGSASGAASGVSDTAGDLSRVMRKDQIRDFVSELMAIGCEITAIGHRGYVFGDADLGSEAARTRARAIARSYGERDHLKRDIVEYLRSIGRCIDFDKPRVD
ncbi:hypothetical protein [Mesorhizobium sp. 2RAF21]|uniref:hypothetical protein n=1 Tax=Mesorhizobium sp. 2RAF21 TaxID=3232995 RepID=UPI003F99BF3E